MESGHDPPVIVPSPGFPAERAPSAVLGIEVSNVTQELDDIKGLVASIDGSVGPCIFCRSKTAGNGPNFRYGFFTKDFSQNHDIS